MTLENITTIVGALALITGCISAAGFLLSARTRRRERAGNPKQMADPEAVFDSDKDWQAQGLTRRRLDDFPMVVGNMAQYEYTCKCGTVLSEGPSGGIAVNAVCHPCRVNYGCLPGYWGDPVLCVGPSKHPVRKVTLA